MYLASTQLQTESTMPELCRTDLRHVQGHGLIQWLRQHVRQGRRLHRLGHLPAQPAPPPG